MSVIRIVKDHANDSSLLDEVIKATDNNTEALGFFPEGVYRDAAVSGQLWILVEKKRYCGHLLYGGNLPTLQIKQLFVVEDMRGRGLARHLIDALVDYAEEQGYTSIRARVAADLKANGAWERLGFITLDTILGGQTTGRTINKRFRQLKPRGPQTHWLAEFDAHARTSSLVARGMPINRDHWYTLDLNVWLDFARQREPFYSAARALIEEASRGQFRLRFTKEAMVEAQRTSDGRAPDPLIDITRTWQAVPEYEDDEISLLVENLREMVFPDRSLSRRDAANDDSDLRHLAMSIHAGASGFITREKAILRQHHALWRQYSFHVVTPGELIEPRDPRASRFTAPQVGLTIDPIEKMWAKAAKQVSKAMGTGARFRDLDQEDKGWVCSIESSIAGIIFWRPVHHGDMEIFLWVANEEERDTRQQAFDILLGHLMDAPRSALLLYRMLLRADRDTCDHYRGDLCRIGFFPTNEPDHFVRFASGKPLSLDNWQHAKTDVEKELGVQSKWVQSSNSGPALRFQHGNRIIEIDAFDIETYFGITGMTLTERTAFYVPIREQYALELLPRPVRPPLFHEHDASFRVERVYYRSPKTTGKLCRGDLLFFYVTEPLKAVIGVARCTVSEVLKTGEAKERFRRLAVLDPEERFPDQVHCIAFDNYIHFPHPVKRTWLSAHNAMPRQNMITLVQVPGSTSYIELICEGLRRDS